MKNYVCGFAFNRRLQLVVLIHRDHPPYQAGKWNGVGGKMDERESAVDAMQRELLEETGVDVGNANWHKFAELKGKQGNSRDSSGEEFTIYFFRTFLNSKQIYQCVTMESQVIERFHLTDLTHISTMANLRWLIWMAWDNCNDAADCFEIKEHYKE